MSLTPKTGNPKALGTLFPEPGPPPPPPFQIINTFNSRNGDAYVSHLENYDPSLVWPPYNPPPNMRFDRHALYVYNLSQATIMYMSHHMRASRFDRTRVASHDVYSQILQEAAEAALRARQTVDAMSWAAMQAAAAEARRIYGFP